MKSFKILIISMLILSAWNGFAQSTGAGSQNQGPLPATINQVQEDYNPAVVPAGQRSAGSDAQPRETVQSDKQAAKDDPDSPALIRNKDSRYTPVSATEADRPESTDPASPDYNPAIISPENVKSKKSEL